MEQRLDQLEKRNKRLTVALTMIAVTIAAVVTMAATNVRDVSNREIKRWELHRDPRSLGGRSHYLLDNATGEMWQIGLAEKQRVVEGEIEN